MRLEVLPVAVPPGAADPDERHARLDQPAGDQRLLAELGRAVLVADPCGSCVMSNSLSLAIRPRTRWYASLWLPRSVEVRPRANRWLSSSRSSAALDVVEFGDRLGPADILGDQAGGQLHRRVPRAEEAGRAGRSRGPRSAE